MNFVDGVGTVLWFSVLTLVAANIIGEIFNFKDDKDHRN